MATKNEAEKKKATNRLKAFFRGVLNELKKVHWPDRKQLITYTGVVVVFVLVVSLAISALDWLFSGLIHYILR
ncbi:MAG: preprotein translocase subunit SecE [Firmicutes bacterium]|nr:preprotein translocase subunit SecE [Bacillota bacterium]